MAVTDGEVRRYGTNLFVLGNAQTDTGGAVGVGALANEVANRYHVADALVELFEALVNLAERRLVDGSTYLPLVVPVVCHRIAPSVIWTTLRRRRQGTGPRVCAFFTKRTPSSEGGQGVYGRLPKQLG